MNVNRKLTVLLALAISLPIQAEIYKWVDGNGGVHFTSSKPAGAASPDEIQAIDIQASPAAPRQTPADSPLQAAPPQVDLYITSWCPYCKKAMAFLRGNNIAFSAYDIEQDFAAASRKKQLDPNYSGVPLAIINGVKIRGFDEEEFQAALANKSD
jgi:glutaredoxin